MKKYYKTLFEIIKNSKDSIIIETQDLFSIVHNLELESSERFFTSEVYEYSTSKNGRDKKDQVPNQYYIKIKHINTPFKQLLR